MNSRGIKAEGTPMAQMGMQQGGNSPPSQDPKEKLPTFIYDYFLKIRKPALAKALLDDAEVGVQVKIRDANGIDNAPKDPIDKRIQDLPLPDIAEQLPNESFLQDWFCIFWDMWYASRGGPASQAANTYNSIAARMKNSNIMMNNRMAAGRMMGNGMNPLPGQAMMNNIRGRGGPMMNPGQMTQAGAESQRPQSPMSGDNQPSPKRQRMEGGFPNPTMGGNPGPGQAPNMQPNMDPSQFPMINGMGMIDADNRMQSAQGGALADYQMQLMLLEQQNKRRLLMARQEQEVVAGTGQPGAAGQPAMMNQGGYHMGMPPGMSPRRSGQSPSPNNGMRKDPSQMGQSPRPDGMAVTRGSPAPPMFDPSNPQQAMANQQFFQNGAMRPNGMGPGPQGAFQGPNGPMRPMPGMQGRPGGPGAQFGHGMQPFAQNPQQQPQNPNTMAGAPQGNQPPSSMPPPQAPLNQTGRTNPSSPAPGQAPPTPRQGKEGGPKKKDSSAKKDTKSKAQPKKTGATPSSEAEAHPPTPTPSTPVDPHPPPSVLSKAQPNGVQQGAGANGMQAQAGTQPDMSGVDPQQVGGLDNAGDGTMENFNFDFSGSVTNDVLGEFDFDSFLQVDDSGYDFSNAPLDFGGPMGNELTDAPH